MAAAAAAPEHRAVGSEQTVLCCCVALREAGAAAVAAAAPRKANDFFECAHMDLLISWCLYALCARTMLCAEKRRAESRALPFRETPQLRATPLYSCRRRCCCWKHGIFVREVSVLVLCIECGGLNESPAVLLYIYTFSTRCSQHIESVVHSRINYTKYASGVSAGL